MNDLTEYLNGAVERLILRALKSAFKNPRESAFITKFYLFQKSAAKRRQKTEADGLHIPPFLIASIASQCNLFCKGCYARANHACGNKASREDLTAADWQRIFSDAAGLGITFILLAGGEPLLRRDVLDTAARFQNIIFPVFTNGTMLDGSYLKFFSENRHMIPILSMEGDSAETDNRRGEGVAAVVSHAKAQMKASGIFYGVSITVTTENLDMVTDGDFVSGLSNDGCNLILYVEYVPAQASTESLSLKEDDRARLAQRELDLKSKFENTVFLSFPGDEKYTGGCLAAGRGFFHINAAGGAEPCPFSPYSDLNLKDKSLSAALRSPLFQKISSNGLLQGEHIGGCALFEKRKEVKELLEIES